MEPFAREMEQVWKLLRAETFFDSDVLECRRIWKINPSDYQGRSDLFWLTAWGSHLRVLGRARHFRYRVSKRNFDAPPKEAPIIFLGQKFAFDGVLTQEESEDPKIIFEYPQKNWTRTMDLVLKKYGLPESFRSRVSEFVVAGTSKSPIIATRYTVTSSLSLELKGQSSFWKNVLGEPIVTINVYGQISDAESKAAAREANAILNNSRYKSVGRRKDFKVVEDYISDFLPLKQSEGGAKSTYSEILYNKRDKHAKKGDEPFFLKPSQERKGIDLLRKAKKKAEKRTSSLFPPDTYKS